MRVGKYSFQCRFINGAILPPYKGSTLRGGFGAALKRICCALRHQECGPCLLFETCAYVFLFEVKKVLSFESRSLRTAQRPHPYVLVPPADQKREYAAADPFVFDIILFGRANEYLPHIVYAVRQMGQTGVGKRSQSDGRFDLETVSQGEQIIFSGDTLTADRRQELVSLDAGSDHVGGDLTITCLTPLRLKYNNELQRTLPFHLIIRAALRRVSILETIYGDGSPCLDFRGLAARATGIKIIKKNCQWVDIPRYSSRQLSRMDFGGVQGSIVYGGEGLAEFMPLLRYCEVTHLGKQTSFGFGKIAVQAEGEG